MPIDQGGDSKTLGNSGNINNPRPSHYDELRKSSDNVNRKEEEGGKRIKKSKSQKKWRKKQQEDNE